MFTCTRERYEIMILMVTVLFLTKSVSNISIPTTMINAVSKGNLGLYPVANFENYISQSILQLATLFFFAKL